MVGLHELTHITCSEQCQAQRRCSLKGSHCPPSQWLSLHIQVSAWRAGGRSSLVLYFRHLVHGWGKDKATLPGACLLPLLPPSLTSPGAGLSVRPGSRSRSHSPTPVQAAQWPSCLPSMTLSMTVPHRQARRPWPLGNPRIFGIGKGNRFSEQAPYPPPQRPSHNVKDHICL